MILYGGGAPNDGGSNGGGGGAASALKKGPWTAAEDEILAAYVREHGEGNWNAVQKNTGLARCGKSCRLRWANHLRPNLKKGAFSDDEERLIIQLHAQLGNKWARMAAQLPGRTDNEIKNYWNTRLKRLQRQGLPLYPPDIIPNHQLQSHHHHQRMYLQPQSQPTTTTTSAGAAAGTSSSSSFTFQTTGAANVLSPLSPTPCHTPTAPQTPSRLSSTPPLPISPPLSSPRQYSTLPLFALPKSPTLHHHASSLSHDHTAFTFPRHPPLLQPPSLRTKRSVAAPTHCGNHSPHNIIPTASINTNVACSGGISGAPFSPPGKGSYATFLTLPYSSPTTPTGSTSYHNHNESSSLLVSSSPSTSPLHSFSLNTSPYHSSPPHTLMLHTHFTPSSLQSTEPVYSTKPELPSNQMFHSSPVGGYDVANLTDNEKHYHQNLDNRRSSCELLENVLDEAEALAGGGRAPKRRQVMVLPDDNNNNENNNNLGSFGHCTSSKGLCSPQGFKPREDESIQMNAMQEDIAKLLDWGSDSGEISNGHSSVVTDDNLVLDVHQFASLFPVDATAAANDDQNKNNNTSCSWDNLPGIC